MSLKYFIQGFHNPNYWTKNYWAQYGEFIISGGVRVYVTEDKFHIDCTNELYVLFTVNEKEIILMSELIGIIEWYRGDSYPLELTIKNKSDGEVIDLTGYSFILTVDTLKTPPDDTTKVFEVAGVLDADPSTGKVSFTPTTTDTNIDPASYYYDVQMIDSSGHIRTIAKNKWKLLQDITK